MKSGVYKLYWDNCDYFYYGSSNNILKRYRGHLRLIKNNTHLNKKVSEVAKIYGAPKLEIIIFCEKNDLLRNEQIYLTREKNNKYSCNIVSTAGSNIGHKMPPVSEETRRKLSEAKKGRVVSKETREKLRITSTGRKNSPEARLKISINNKGKKRSEDSRKNISLGLKGRVFSQEHRKNIGKTKIGNKYRLGMMFSEETKKKCSESQKKNKENCARIAMFNIDRMKKVCQIDAKTGEAINSFDSIAKAYLATRVDRKSIIRCCKNKQSLAGGYIWKYL